MLIMADNDVTGAVEALRRILQSDEWAALTSAIELRFADFEELGLPRSAPDRLVWQACQRIGVVLITANRVGGDDSLDQVIRDLSGTDSLPILTIGNAKRLVRERSYAEEAAFSLLDYLERIDTLRGTGRLYIP